MNSKIQRLIELGIFTDPNTIRKETQRNRFGVMVWDHKTAGTCQVMNGDSFKQASQYMAQPGHRSGIKKFGFRG